MQPAQPTSSERRYARTAMITAIVIAPALLLAIMLEIRVFSPAAGEYLPFWSAMPVLPIVLLTPLVLLVGLGFLPFRRLRRAGMHALVVALVAVAGCVGGSEVQGRVRMAGFRRVAVRAQPLVNAITQYERARGAPPESLGVLVPDYLQAVPGTGLGPYPRWEYEVLKSPPPSSAEGTGSPWELRLPCSSGPMNWDVFFYWPTHRYPGAIYGGSVERVGDWAYVHE